MAEAYGTSYVANANLTATLVATDEANGGSGAFLPQMWKKGAELNEGNNDFFQEFEGKGNNSPIRVENDFTKDAGQTITFRTREGLYADGVIGDELIGDNVEEWEVGDFQLSVDYIRHAIRVNRRTEDQTALASEIAESKNEDLGAWLGRKKTKHLSMMFREKLHATSQIFAGAEAGVSTIDALRSDHTISMNGIISWGTQLETLGGKPAMVGRDGNNPVMKYILVAVNEALTSLKQAADYKQAQREAQVRGESNRIWSGGYEEIDGHIIKKYTPLDHAGRGAIGSAMNAKAILGNAIIAGNTLPAITGGGNPTKAALSSSKYFEFFPLYAYRFTPADILSTSGGPYYLLIYNLQAGPGGGNAGQMGFYSYSANNGNQLTMAARLRSPGSMDSTNSFSTLGNVTWNTGTWANKHTDNHPQGAVVIRTNSYGVPIGVSFFLGADAARRGYGRFRNERTEQSYEGKFVNDTFITSVFGQTPTRRSDQRTPNALVITHAITYAGLPGIPSITN